MKHKMQLVVHASLQILTPYPFLLSVWNSSPKRTNSVKAGEGDSTGGQVLNGLTELPTTDRRGTQDSQPC